MNQIEQSIVEFIQRQFAAGALSVTEKEIMAAIVPAEHPEFRFKSSYKYALERLLRRHVINAINTSEGLTHYFIGNCATPELLRSLDLS